MAKTGIVDMVVTEDSDLIAYGCPRVSDTLFKYYYLCKELIIYASYQVLFKLDKYGRGDYFERSKLPVCFGMTAEQLSDEKVIQICVLSGCDYSDNIANIGIEKILQIVRKHDSCDIKKVN